MKTENGKTATELADLRKKFGEKTTMYAPEDFSYQSEYVKRSNSRCDYSSAKCGCGESRAIYFDIFPGKLNKVICCGYCYKDAPAGEKFV